MPEAFQKLMDSVEDTMQDTIEREEKVPIDQVTNFPEVSCYNRHRRSFHILLQNVPVQIRSLDPSIRFDLFELDPEISANPILDTDIAVKFYHSEMDSLCHL